MNGIKWKIHYELGESLLIDKYKELLYVYTGQYSLIVVCRFNDPN